MNQELQRSWRSYRPRKELFINGAVFTFEITKTKLFNKVVVQDIVGHITQLASWSSASVFLYFFPLN